jgi:hypothetical protein
MRNRFENRQVLCEGIGGFNPVGGAGSVNQSTSINSVRPTEVSALNAIRGITGEATNINNLSISGKVCTACQKPY